MREPMEIAADIRNLEFWDYDLCTELCEAAGLEEEWEKASTEEDGNFEQVIERAAEKLGVEIY